MPDPIHSTVRRPFNPYYLCIWTVVFLIVASVVFITNPNNITQIIYQFFNLLGAEDILVRLDRPARIKAFLLENNQVDRWHSIVGYFSIYCATMVVLSIVILISATRYLRWYKTINSNWKHLLSGQAYVMLFSGLCLLLAGVIACYGDFVAGAQYMTASNLFSNSIQVSDWGFFDLSIDGFVILFGLQGVHFIVFRVACDLQLRRNRS